MASLTQLHLFEQNDEISLLKREIVILKKNQEKLRRDLMARHNELAHLCIVLKEELDQIKRDAVKQKEQNSRHVEFESKSEDPYDSLFKEAYLGNASKH